jgi:hypothetical protein
VNRWTHRSTVTWSASTPARRAVLDIAVGRHCCIGGTSRRGASADCFR